MQKSTSMEQTFACISLGDKTFVFSLLAAPLLTLAISSSLTILLGHRGLIDLLSVHIQLLSVWMFH